MLAEFGQFCLILAFTLAVCQLVFFVTQTIRPTFVTPVLQYQLIRNTSLGQIFFVVLAYSILTLCFVNNDFSVAYVAQNSNSLLPIYYKITAVWGGHEGSLLMWVFILNLWNLAVFNSSRNWDNKFAANVLSIIGLVNLGFLILLIFYSNPFLRILSDIPIDGNDLNPVLQDKAMISHPPILYMGYVGMTIPFAFAVAALIVGRVDIKWAQMLRPWAQLAWMFLTLGITIGSWWAYYELGWGGWWFWDPVENASFMPWITGTALLHCLASCSKNSRLLLLAIFLAIISFALSLFGTFIVRSGVISSVHAFATDPERGRFILQFLLFIVGSALLLYGTRARHVATDNAGSRSDTLIFYNNIILLSAAAAVFLGTTYPIFYQLLYKTSISIGVQYFNMTFLPLMLVLSILLLFAIHRNSKVHLIIFMLCIVSILFFLQVWFQSINILALVGLVTGVAIFANTVYVYMFNNRKSQLAMHIAHIGLAVTIIGISIVSIYEVERDAAFKLGDQLKIANHTITLKKIEIADGPNYITNIATFEIHRPNDTIATLQPEKRLYLAQELPTSETSILPGVFQDIYLALGQQFDDGSWSVRVYYKPFVRWIWSGAILMILGAIYGFVQHVRFYVK